MTAKKRKSRTNPKSTPTNTVVEEIKVEIGATKPVPVKDTKEPIPFLIKGEKQYWHNKINCSGRLIQGLVYEADVKQFFELVGKVDYSTWMSKTDRIQERLDLIKAKIKRKTGLK